MRDDLLVEGLVSIDHGLFDEALLINALEYR